MQKPPNPTGRPTLRRQRRGRNLGLRDRREVALKSRRERTASRVSLTATVNWSCCPLWPLECAVAHRWNTMDDEAACVESMTRNQSLPRLRVKSPRPRRPGPSDGDLGVCPRPLLGGARRGFVMSGDHGIA